MFRYSSWAVLALLRHQGGLLRCLREPSPSCDGSEATPPRHTSNMRGRADSSTPWAFTARMNNRRKVTGSGRLLRHQIPRACSAGCVVAPGRRHAAYRPGPHRAPALTDNDTRAVSAASCTRSHCTRSRSCGHQGQEPTLQAMTNA